MSESGGEKQKVLAGGLLGDKRVVRRISRPLRLRRTLGVPSLFSTGYGNVGSSIYYALGVTASFALGATPLALTLAGAFFVLTVLTYAEATVAVPEAGGASNFARQGFNEFVSFITGWGTLLSYTVTISISSFSAAAYLSVFFPVLQSSQADVVFSVVTILLLMVLNIVGVNEAAIFSVLFAVIDLITEVLLVVVGSIFLVNVPLLIHQIHWGTAPTLGNFFHGSAFAMVAYTGIETISNMSEEAATPSKTVPRAYGFLIIAVLVLFAGISIVALSAMPVRPCLPSDHCAAGVHFTTDLATKYRNDPVAGIVKALPHPYSDIMLPLVAILASSILLIGANAGVLGASRLSFSMGSYRQVPKFLNRVHKRFKTPYVAVSFFCGMAILIVLPGDIIQLTALYIFGSTLGFTMAHASLIAMRLKETPETRSGFRLGLNIPFRGKQIPITAVIGGLGTLIVFLLIALTDMFGRYVGFSWLLIGVIVFVVYRKRNNLSLVESSERRFEMR
ncbi:MAG: UspA domain protein [Chloroflexi bacterium]|nr:UspA domain protein [Chloroflexota bacterium]